MFTDPHGELKRVWDHLDLEPIHIDELNRLKATHAPLDVPRSFTSGSPTTTAHGTSGSSSCPGWTSPGTHNRPRGPGMEIVDYLRAARRRLSLIILIPLLSAGAAAALLYAQPTMYMATATVDPPALVGGPTAQYTGAQGVIQFVAAFQATASGPMVRTAISEQTGVSTTALGDRLVVTQRGGSPSVAVTFTSSDKASWGLWSRQPAA